MRAGSHRERAHDRGADEVGCTVAVALKVDAAELDRQRAVLADRDQCDVDRRGAIEPGLELGCTEGEVGVQLVLTDDLDHILLCD